MGKHMENMGKLGFDMIGYTMMFHNNGIMRGK
jgi:hypothetical protein